MLLLWGLEPLWLFERNQIEEAASAGKLLLLGALEWQGSDLEEKAEMRHFPFYDSVCGESPFNLNLMKVSSRHVSDWECSGETGAKLEGGSEQDGILPEMRQNLEGDG